MPNSRTLSGTHRHSTAPSEMRPNPRVLPPPRPGAPRISFTGCGFPLLACSSLGLIYPEGWTCEPRVGAHCTSVTASADLVGAAHKGQATYGPRLCLGWVAGGNGPRHASRGAVHAVDIGPPSESRVWSSFVHQKNALTDSVLGIQGNTPHFQTRACVRQACILTAPSIGYPFLTVAQVLSPIPAQHPDTTRRSSGTGTPREKATRLDLV
ncbi:hypothetical protein F5X68DRAFT_37010 [Plectosphaerella plurivora]|uniref:Uncharacterized protein n=1 Tax=Plectosphaerella plurivora TaxID=936078 RepID=A0A9P8V6N0_9PEZI|nr:hypothetical protein F5X68DRAFT_37010 [Plectosphaerella plurivora]